VNGDVHVGQARCGSVIDASRFLIGLVTCFATHDGIPASGVVARLPQEFWLGLGISSPALLPRGSVCR
jgi:hypothetical protein